MSFNLDTQLLDLAHNPNALSKELNLFLASSTKIEVRVAWASRFDHAPELELERVMLEQANEVLQAFLLNPKLTKKSFIYLLNSNNKSISLLAALSKNASAKQANLAIKKITKPVLKKYISLNIVPISQMALSEHGESLLLKFTEIRLLMSLNLSNPDPKEIYARIMSINFDNSKGERNMMFTLIFLAKNKLLTTELLLLLYKRYSHPFLFLLLEENNPDIKEITHLELYFLELTKYLELEYLLKLLNLLNFIPFDNIYANLNLTADNVVTLLKLYPSSIYTYLDCRRSQALPIMAVVDILQYILQDKIANMFTYFNSIFLIPLQESVDVLYKEIVDRNCFENKRLSQFIAKSPATTLEIALNLDAWVSISAYHNQRELVEYMFKELTYRDFEALRVMAKEFDGSVKELLSIVKNFGYYQ